MSGTNLEEKLRQFGPWNFLIEIEPGIFTIPRMHWQGVWNNIIVQDYITKTLFPLIDALDDSDKSNTTVIDIGCNDGWLSLLFHRAGFKKVVGIDLHENNIKKALFLKEHFKMDNVEFLCTDINGFKPEESFDLSVMLGVINHTHNPVSILENIYGFTKKYLIMDFDAFCSDYIETSPEPKFDAGLSSVFGNMKCHFEPPHEVTSSDDNLVFQYSKRAMTLMMHYAGFSDIFQVLPKLSTPAHFKNEKRVMLVGKRSPDKNHYKHDIALDRDYAEARKLFEHSTPVLTEEGYKKFNIVQYGKTYYGIPQGEMTDFDIFNVLMGGKCLFGSSFEETKGRIDRFSGKRGATVEEICGEFEYDRLKLDTGVDLLMQSRLEEAKKIFTELSARHTEPVTELTTGVLYHLGRIARRSANPSEAKEYWTKCISINPKFEKARQRLRELDSGAQYLRCHEIFD